MTEAAGPSRPHLRAALTHRHVLAIAIPIILSNTTTPLIGFVDTVVIGRLGNAALMGGVAIGAVIFNIVYWGFGFLRMGTTGLTAQAVGRGDASETAAMLFRGLAIAATAGLLLVVLQTPIAAVTFAVLDGSAAVESTARHYYDIRIWSSPAGIANYALLGWFIGLGRAGRAFLIQLFLNGLNILLDPLLIFGWGPVPAFGVEGAAIATNMLSRTAEAAADVLRGPGGIDERLAGALRAGILEPMTVIMQSPHGAEILDMKGELIADIYTGWRADMLAALTRAIEAEAQTAGADLKSKGLSAAGLAETLLDGIEGVKLRSTDPAEWQRGADRLVALAMLALR